MIGDWTFPTTIRMGAGRSNELAQACSALGITRALVITDPTVAKLAEVERTLASLLESGLEFELNDEVSTAATKECLARSAHSYRDKGCNGVVAIGGRSPIDVAKMVSLKATDGAPVVALPTITGSGAEVSPTALLSDPKTKTTELTCSSRLIPDLVIADPQLLVSLPPQLTASTGLEALARCLEALCRPTFNPFFEGIALEGLRLAVDNLETTFQNPSDLTARSAMMCASMMGATASQETPGTASSVSHTLRTHYDLHQSLLVAIMIAYVLEFERPAFGKTWSRLTSIFDGDPVRWVVRVRRQLGIPNTLTEAGVTDRAERLVTDSDHQQLIADALNGFLKANQIA